MYTLNNAIMILLFFFVTIIIIIIWNMIVQDNDDMSKCLQYNELYHSENKPTTVPSGI